LRGRLGVWGVEGVAMLLRVLRLAVAIEDQRLVSRRTKAARVLSLSELGP
jgi:hypothetical protein